MNPTIVAGIDPATAGSEAIAAESMASAIHRTTHIDLTLPAQVMPRHM